ncbi:protoheme IX farnesyltransferase [Chlamydia abortus]|uniref:Uncharacterized protein n=1 Tax=Paenibacillus residui TaxID=629724 RepID=A0ABW3DG92_9BACL|nr:hypothetical protein [Paenibacillus sp. 32O-W]SHE11703.1 protoheme IX farnesyltransferase [Chlamydia abortus]
MIKDWIQLTKPRILQLNLVTAFGRYWLASRNFVLLILILDTAGSSF